MTPGSARTNGRLLHAEITQRVLLTIFAVYNELGTGFLESVYRTALARALTAFVPEHEAQLLHYLRATAMEVGLLLPSARVRNSNA